MTWFSVSPYVCFLSAFWGQNPQVLLNLVRLSNPPSAPLISAPPPFPQPVDLVFCSIALFKPSEVSYVKKLNNLPPSLSVEELQKASLWHAMKTWVWLNICKSQHRHCDHVIREHIQGEDRTVAPVLHQGGIKTTLATVCILFRLNRACTNRNLRKLVGCLPTSVTEKHRGAEHRG